MPTCSAPLAGALTRRLHLILFVLLLAVAPGPMAENNTTRFPQGSSAAGYPAPELRTQRGALGDITNLLGSGGPAALWALLGGLPQVRLRTAVALPSALASGVSAAQPRVKQCIRTPIAGVPADSAAPWRDPMRRCRSTAARFRNAFRGGTRSFHKATRRFHRATPQPMPCAKAFVLPSSLRWQSRGQPRDRLPRHQDVTHT